MMKSFKDKDMVSFLRHYNNSMNKFSGKEVLCTFLISFAFDYILLKNLTDKALLVKFFTPVVVFILVSGFMLSVRLVRNVKITGELTEEL